MDIWGQAGRTDHSSTGVPRSRKHSAAPSTGQADSYRPHVYDYDQSGRPLASSLPYSDPYGASSSSSRPPSQSQISNLPQGQREHSPRGQSDPRSRGQANPSQDYGTQGTQRSTYKKGRTQSKTPGFVAERDIPDYFERKDGMKMFPEKPAVDFGEALKKAFTVLRSALPKKSQEGQNDGDGEGVSEGEGDHNYVDDTLPACQEFLEGFHNYQERLQGNMQKLPGGGEPVFHPRKLFDMPKINTYDKYRKFKTEPQPWAKVMNFKHQYETLRDTKLYPFKKSPSINMHYQMFLDLERRTRRMTQVLSHIAWYTKGARELTGDILEALEGGPLSEEDREAAINDCKSSMMMLDGIGVGVKDGGWLSAQLLCQILLEARDSYLDLFQTPLGMKKKLRQHDLTDELLFDPKLIAQAEKIATEYEGYMNKIERCDVDDEGNVIWEEERARALKAKDKKKKEKADPLHKNCWVRDHYVEEAMNQKQKPFQRPPQPKPYQPNDNEMPYIAPGTSEAERRRIMRAHGYVQKNNPPLQPGPYKQEFTKIDASNEVGPKGKKGKMGKNVPPNSPRMHQPPPERPGFYPPPGMPYPPFHPAMMHPGMRPPPPFPPGYGPPMGRGKGRAKGHTITAAATAAKEVVRAQSAGKGSKKKKDKKPQEKKKEFASKIEAEESSFYEELNAIEEQEVPQKAVQDEGDAGCGTEVGDDHQSKDEPVETEKEEEEKAGGGSPSGDATVPVEAESGGGETVGGGNDGPAGDGGPIDMFSEGNDESVVNEASSMEERRQSSSKFDRYKDAHDSASEEEDDYKVVDEVAQESD